MYARHTYQVTCVDVRHILTRLSTYPSTSSTPRVRAVSSTKKYDGMVLHCLLSLLHYDVVSLLRNFVIKELVSLLRSRMTSEGAMTTVVRVFFTLNRFFYVLVDIQHTQGPR